MLDAMNFLKLTRRSLGKTVRYFRSLAEVGLDLGVYLLPFVVGAVVLYALLSVDQGVELVRIARETQHGFIEQIALAIIPCMFGASTLIVGCLFLYSRLDRRAIGISVSWVAIFGAIVPIMLLSRFPMTTVYIVVGLVLLFVAARLLSRP